MNKSFGRICNISEDGPGLRWGGTMDAKHTWFVLVGVFLYLFLVTFVGVTPTGQHYADMILGFIMGELLRSMTARKS